MTSNLATTDVLIVGAGPVGLTLACDLAQRNVAVTMIDTLPAPTTESRAIAVHSRSLDHIAAIGALDALMDRAVIAQGMQFHSGEHLIADVPFTSIHATRPYSVALAQTDTEAVLTDRLTTLGVQVHRATTLTTLTQDAEHVTADLTNAHGATLHVRARYVVGADGARSIVRHTLGEKLEGSFAGDDFLLGDIDGDHDYDPTAFHTFFSPGQTTGLLFPLPQNRLRVFAQLPSGTDRNRPATVEWLQQAMTERDIDVRITRTHWLARFELKHAQVPAYRSGRVFLAGDAAHIHSPAGALGMNTGMQDAFNLGWKLAYALDADHADANMLLDSYQQERHPVAADVITFTTRLSKIGTLSNTPEQHIRNTLMQLGLGMPEIAGTVAGTVEQQNVTYRHSPIVTGHGAHLRPGDYLYLPDTDIAAALASAPGHLLIILPGPDLTQNADTEMVTLLPIPKADDQILRHASGLHDGGVVLIRPDGYIGHIGATIEPYPLVAPTPGWNPLPAAGADERS